jgi:hypothetical protein
MGQNHRNTRLLKLAAAFKEDSGARNITPVVREEGVLPSYDDLGELAKVLWERGYISNPIAAARNISEGVEAPINVDAGLRYDNLVNLDGVRISPILDALLRGTITPRFADGSKIPTSLDINPGAAPEIGTDLSVDREDVGTHNLRLRGVGGTNPLLGVAGTYPINENLSLDYNTGTFDFGKRKITGTGPYVGRGPIPGLVTPSNQAFADAAYAIQGSGQRPGESWTQRTSRIFDENFAKNYPLPQNNPSISLNYKF